MTSVYDIPFEDIEEFLSANNENYNDENDAYNKTLILLKNKNSVGHTTKIIEWMMAHNLLLRNINIPNYTTSQINNLSQSEINRLAKLLKMNGSNIENIKHILRYLHKLDNKNKILLPIPELNDIIFSTLNDLESKDINFDTLTPDATLKLLKTHNNKALIRKLIYNNMEKIIFYNYLIGIGHPNLDKLPSFEDLTYQLPKSIVLKLFRINEKSLLKNYKIEELDEFLNFLEELPRGVMNMDLHRNIEQLSNFLVSFLEIKEVSLARRIFDIANEYRFRGQIAHNGYSFNQYLVLISVNQSNEVFNKLLEFIGEKDFLSDANILFIYGSNTLPIKKFLSLVIQSEKYELFITIITLLTIRGNKVTSEVIKVILPSLQKTIDMNNKDVIVKYLDLINIALDGRLGRNTALNMIDKLIRETELSKI